MPSDFDEMFADAADVFQDVFGERDASGKLDEAAVTYHPPGKADFKVGVIARDVKGGQTEQGSASREKRTECEIVVESKSLRDKGVKEIQSNARVDFQGKSWSIDTTRSSFGETFTTLSLYILELVEESQQRKSGNGSV